MVAMGVLLVAGLVVVPSPANAQETPTSQFQTTAGGYNIGVEEFVASLSVGTVQFLVTLRDEDTGQVIDDAHVLVRVKHDRSGEETSATAVNSPNTPERYRARLSLKASGTWRVWVEVDGRLGRVAVEVVPLDIPALRRYSAGTFVFMAVFMVLVSGAVYVWWSSQKALKKRKSDSGSGEANS
jgi:hypothetical protein